MTTIQRQIQQEISELPEYAIEEVLDFARFLREKFARNQQDEVFNSSSKALLRASEEEYERGDIYSFATTKESIQFLEKRSS